MKKLLSVVLVLAVLLTVAPLNGFVGLEWPEIDWAGLFSPVVHAAEKDAGTKKMGDVDGNGEVESADARLVLRASVGLEKFTDVQKTLADVDFDGEISSGDARLVLRASVGLEALKAAVVYEPEKVVVFENNDRIYSESEKHIVHDMDNKAVFYNNLINVYTFFEIKDSIKHSLANKVNGVVVGDLSGMINMFQILISESTYTQIQALCDILMTDENVLWAHSEIPMRPSSSAFDSDPWNGHASEPLADKNNKDKPDGNDWWAEAIDAYTAWELTDGNLQTVNVGVIDNGFYLEHPDLKGKISMLSGYENHVDSNSRKHGTHVSGLIAAENNTIGMRGVCNSAML